ncbi:hypothetical protein BU23DRAFT_301030 [Bimuria novae-zelandiae CBS 107.79]|uniref:Uncharacterized protein n=1 Tax=Bimuria novae-zelandiae CBS 107.79 TaxID=1447943 RepID=A0A6A5UQP2_9PLEO|nr:hypothetical protein BU23DRAFT_301030 [Bimuria novae-zelandiae CBS 107.79]
MKNLITRKLFNRRKKSTSKTSNLAVSTRFCSPSCIHMPTSPKILRQSVSCWIRVGCIHRFIYLGQIFQDERVIQTRKNTPVNSVEGFYAYLAVHSQDPWRLCSRTSAGCCWKPHRRPAGQGTRKVYSGRGYKNGRACRKLRFWSRGFCRRWSRIPVLCKQYETTTYPGSTCHVSVLSGRRRNPGLTHENNGCS